tara:strand:- start:962 stop:1249 length:288 start_codon:yes stop_codon:yes gene_type:complete
MNKKLAITALLSIIIATPALAETSSKIHTVCKKSLKSAENRSGRITLSGIKRNSENIIAKYRTSINGEIRVVNCVWDKDTQMIKGLYDRTTGVEL